MAGNLETGADVVSDAMMVALLTETILPSSPARKAAAQILLAQLRQDSRIDVSNRTLEMVRADDGAEVAREVQTLAADLLPGGYHVRVGSRSQH